MTRIAPAIYRSAVLAAAICVASVRAQLPVAAAQSASEPMLVETLGAERAGIGFHETAGEIWVRGANYKARADTTGFTFIPFLGSRAPRTWPVRFTLVEALQNGSAIPLQHGAPEREEARVSFDRGGVTVRYDLDDSSVEQSFVIEGVAGRDVDLELRVALETDLAVTVDGRGIVMHGPQGGVAFGAATVLDATGRSMAIETQVEPGFLTLHVPAWFIARAEGTIVVDPVITTLAIDEFGADLSEPDVAFEVTSNTYCVVYEESFAATDVDLYWRTLDAATFAILDQGYVDLSAGRSTGPKLASNAQNDTFLVAFQREDASGRPELYARVRPSAGGAFWAAEIQLTSFDPLFVRVNHDVGGDASEGVGASNYLVVWEKRSTAGGPAVSDIQGCIVGGGGAPAPGYIDITASAMVPNGSPAVSKCTGDPSAHAAWWVAYVDEDMAATKSNLRGARIAFDGTITDPDSLFWSILGATAIRNVEVSSPYAGVHDETVHVSFDYELLSGGTRSDLFSIGRTGPVELRNSKGIDRIDVSDAGSNEGAALAALADRAVLIYIDQGKPTASFDLLASSLEFVVGAEVAVGERRVVIDHYDPGYSASGQAASRASGGDRASRRILVVWARQAPGSGGTNIHGALLDFPEPASIGGNVCRGFKNSTGDYGYLTAFGDNATTTLKSLRATGLPANALGYFIAGTAPSAIRPPASEGLLCVGGSIGRYVGSILNSGPTGTYDFVIDPAAIAQPANSAAALPGDTWYFQVWHRDANPASTSNLTNAVAVGF